MNNDEDSLHDDPFQDGVEALSRLVAGCAAKAVAESLLDEYSSYSASASRKALRARLPWRKFMALRFRLAALAAENARTSEDPQRVRDAFLELADALLHRLQDRNLLASDKAAIVWCVDRLLQGVRQPPRLRKQFGSAMRAHGADPAAVSRIAGWDEAAFGDLLDQSRPALQPPKIHSLKALRPGALSRPPASPAEHLVTEAGVMREPSGDISYDRSDQEVKLKSITAAGFRGIPTSRTLDLTKNGKPVSALIFGGNGVGKSSFVDAAEFALQGRVGRASDFDSSLAPALVSFSATNATRTLVELSDGSSVSRSLTRDSTGRARIEGLTLRPGFRLAPISLKRADILRFLDTDALSRGTIFFDYFPGDASRMGMRPDEELAALREEQHGLRIRRQALARSLARHLKIFRKYSMSMAGICLAL